MNDNPMLAWAERLKELRDRKNDLEECLKTINAEINIVEEALTNYMDTTGMKSFNHDGTTFSLTTKTRASVKAGFKEILFKALRKTGNGDMITETINANSLSGFVKEQRELHGGELPEWLEGLVNVFDQITVSVRKAR